MAKRSPRQPAAGKPKTVRKSARAVVKKSRPARPARPKRPARRPVGAKRPGEPPDARRARAQRILDTLAGLYPGATTALRHRDAYELLVATILSAQCTDERVNRVTPDLFRRYPNVAVLAAADPAELEEQIRSTGFFRNKTKSLVGMARAVTEQHAGEVPGEMEQLLKLPGVARKTANCVLGTWFRENEGVVVDTHVGRLAVRLNLSPAARNEKDAERIERDLMEVFPQASWTFLAHALILHGRQICTARKPQCAQCALVADCPSAFTFAKSDRVSV